MLWRFDNLQHVYLKTVMVPANKVRELAPACWTRDMQKTTAPVGPPMMVDMGSKDSQWTEFLRAPDAHFSKAGGHFVTVCAAY